MIKPYLKYILPVIIPLIILFLPTTGFGIEGLTLVEQRVIAIFFMAALCWVLEPIPIYATSVLIIVFELLLISDNGLWFATNSPLEIQGHLLKQSTIMATFASPIIMLFLGGFFLAMAATKFRLDINLARVLLRPFGHRPKYVMLGIMMITAVFSMFMSNTATTAMMLSILTPVLALFSKEDIGKVAFALSVPVAANIGGIATPIGTPPNAVALKYLVDQYSVSFAGWMAFGVPFVVVMLLIAWLLLNHLFPADTKAIKLDIEGQFLKTPKAYLVYITFAATILLWLLGAVHGMSSYVVAMLPVAIFSMFKIITKEDLRNISWDVLWLVSGGIALGVALDESGLASNVINAVPFNSFHPLLLIAVASLLCLLMANFMSNTATANLLLPLVAALGASMHSLLPYGGQVVLILAVTFSASLGMSLPVSTPPNALAYASGHIKNTQMLKVGVIIGIIGLLVTFTMLFVLNQLGLVGGGNIY
ncbi:SLC13 family permease [Psychromonas antarctica]|jgi:sodium-dependent dicarboxylate transporter 2/3/5|uniref:SLC13 family permease n=1 Tax=Psychromonas antarctica TaxID=67573 RepID=UPI001EE86B1B|nr:SLC13 family permease [Psychromonas antarctica]MCG6201727.1 SLC13 family permease [Psychromonas antarctica]